MNHWRNPDIRLVAGLIVALLGADAPMAAQADNATKPSETANRTTPHEGQILAGPKVAKDDLHRVGRTFSGKQRGKRQPGFMAVLEQLKLTDKQKDDLRLVLAQIRKTADPEMKKLRANMEAAHKEKNFDQMRQLRKQRREILAKGPNRNTLKTQLATILTPEQVEQFEEKMKAHHQKMIQGKKRRRGKNTSTTNSDQCPRCSRERSQDKLRPKQQPPDNEAEDNKLDL